MYRDKDEFKPFEKKVWLARMIIDKDAMCKQIREEQDVCYSVYQCRGTSDMEPRAPSTCILEPFRAKRNFINQT